MTRGGTIILENENPHEGLSIETKNLIRDIKILMNSHPELSVSKLDDLASIISSKENVYKNIEMRNKWSTPLAVVGLLLTILFGAMSIL